MRQIALILLAVCLLSGCIRFVGESAPEHYFILEGAEAETTPASSKKLIIDLKIVDFPGFLDRNQLVVRDQNNQLNLVPEAHWGEPLKENLLRVLRQNLNLSFSRATISVSPWESHPPGALQVELLINRFSGKPGESVTVQIEWRVRQENEMLRQGHFQQQISIEPGYPNYVAGLSQGLNNFSDELAATLSKLD